MKRRQKNFLNGILWLIASCGISGYENRADEQSVKANDTLYSANQRATLRIGGEINTDYYYSLRARGKSRHPSGLSGDGDWTLHNTNLRFTLDLANGAQGKIKLDLSEQQPYLRQQILEEAQLIWRQICGSPFGVFVGKGEIPYGQDRTLGIIQSYHHNSGSYSAEGQSILNGPLPGNLFDGDNGAGPVWHPGEIDRVVMGGLAMDWDDRVRFEAAVFSPENFTFDKSTGDRDSGWENIAARLWWQTPVEGLVAEISGVRLHDKNRADSGRYGAGARSDSYAFSIGVDYRSPQIPLEIFAEYERGINWNYRTAYNTHTISFGALYDLTTKIVVGAMTEWLRIDARGDIYDYNKLVAHGKYTFSSGLYVIGEYGIETVNFGSAVAHLFALRSGFCF